MSKADWIKLAAGLIPAILVAAFTAMITVRLALRRFYAERWWERKAATYSELLAALHDIVRYGEEFLSAYGEGRDLPQELKGDLTRRSRVGSSRLAREADIGSFIVSEKAAKIIERCKKQMWVDDPNDSIHEMIDRSTSAARTCLVELRDEAKHDLRVP